MAVQQLQLPGNYGPGPNNLVDQSQWSQLANLGNVYREAQDRDRQQATLAQLGTDPNANIGFLMKSGNPALVQMGLRLQQQQTENTRAEAELNIRKAAEARAQGNYDQAEEYRQKAADINKRLLDAATGQGATRGPVPFPAPLPGQTTVPSAAPPPQTAPLPSAAPPGGLSAWAANPPMPAGLQTGAPLPATPAGAPAPPLSVAPPISTANMPPATAVVPPISTPNIPVKAEDEEGGLPAWAGPQSVAGRMAGALVAGQPSKSAGISNALLGEALANPETRDLAKVFADNKLNPGKWTVHHDEATGRFIAFNDKDPSKTVDVTPGGGDGMSKQERAVQGNYRAGLALGMPDEQARAFAANGGKTPTRADISPHEQKTVDSNDDVVMSAGTAIDNINRLQDLSKKAFSGWGASYLGDITKHFGPGAGTATAEYNNIALRNVVAMVKSAFPRPTEYETKLMQKVETGADMPRAQRDDLLSDLKAQLTLRAKQAQFKSDAIRNKTYYKPGGADEAPMNEVSTASAVARGTAAPAAPGAKPSLSDFMTKARAANPGIPDGELARFWKSKYGG